MFRLLIASDNLSPSPWAGVASRLKGIELECDSDPARSLTTGDAHQAVVFAGSQQPDATRIEQLLGAKKHILHAGEPTFARDEFASLVDVAREMNVRFMVANPDRFLPSRQLIKQQIPDKIGQVGLVRMHRWEPTISRASTGSALPGPLLRDLDLATWLVGTLPNVAHALENKAAAGRFLQIHLGFPHGGMALIDYDNRLPSGDGYQSLSVIGASGAAHADDHQNMQLLYRGGRPQAVRTDEGVKALADMIQSFVNAINTNRQPENAFDWQSVFSIADAVEQSLRTRQAVSL